MSSIHDCCHHCGELLCEEAAAPLCYDHRVGEDVVKLADDENEVPSITYEVLDMLEDALLGDDIVR